MTETAITPTPKRDTREVRGECRVCGRAFDPTKDSYVTFYERKGSPVDLCSAACALAWEQS